MTICPITSDCVDAALFRLTLPPGLPTGLNGVSQVMIDKIVGVPRAAIAREIGERDAGELAAVDDSPRRWLGLEWPAGTVAFSWSNQSTIRLTCVPVTGRVASRGDEAVRAAGACV